MHVRIASRWNAHVSNHFWSVTDGSACTGFVISIPEGVTAIGNFAFNLANFEYVALPSTVTTIGTSAFSLNASLLAVSISSSVTSIGTSAFAYNASLQVVQFAANSQLTTIGALAFSNNASLQNIVIPSSVTSIGQSAFSHNASLQIVIFAENSQLTTIGSYAFSDDVSLVDIRIPSSVTLIKAFAFYNNIRLYRVLIPSPTITIEPNFTFFGTPSLRYYSYCSSGSIAGTGLHGTRLPCAPTIDVATATGARSATVAYTAPTYDGGSEIQRYIVLSTPSGGSGALVQAGSGTVTITNLTPGTSYTFKIYAIAVNGASDFSSASNSITTAAAEPDAPTIGVATVTGTTTASVAFTAPGSDGGSTILDYTATSSPGGITATLTQASSGTISLTGLTPGTPYTFTVTARNLIGSSSPSNSSNSVTPLRTGLTPTLAIASATTSSFSVQVNNFDAAYTYSVATTAGSATINGSGLATVAGLSPTQSATLTVTTTRAGYTTESATAVGISQATPMQPGTSRPALSITSTSITCTIGSYSSAPTSAVFSLFVGGKHISTNFSALGSYLPDWIIGWATAATITRTATLTGATWDFSDSYRGKTISCSTLAYANHATGTTTSATVVVN